MSVGLTHVSGARSSAQATWTVLSLSSNQQLFRTFYKFIPFLCKPHILYFVLVFHHLRSDKFLPLFFHIYLYFNIHILIFILPLVLIFCICFKTAGMLLLGNNVTSPRFAASVKCSGWRRSLFSRSTPITARSRTPCGRRRVHPRHRRRPTTSRARRSSSATTSRQVSIAASRRPNRCSTTAVTRAWARWPGGSRTPGSRSASPIR